MGGELLEEKYEKNFFSRMRHYNDDNDAQKKEKKRQVVTRNFYFIRNFFAAYCSLLNHRASFVKDS